MDSDNHAQDDAVICPCSGTKRSQVRAMFLQGLDTEAISRKTGALTGCGGCEWDIAVFLRDLSKSADSE